MKYPRVYRPLERFHFYLTGPLVCAKPGFKYIFVVKEYLTKYVRLFPFKFKTADSKQNGECDRLDVPTRLFSDKGTKFCNKLIINISELFKVSWVTATSSYKWFQFTLFVFFVIYSFSQKKK
jgi:hypothetical protein